MTSGIVYKNEEVDLQYVGVPGEVPAFAPKGYLHDQVRAGCKKMVTAQIPKRDFKDGTFAI